MTQHKNCHVSFHTPGHSGEAYRERGIFNYDVTELSYTDNLLSPVSDVKALNERWAEVYGREVARLVTAGATSAIVVALSILQGTPLVIGDAHMSIYNTLKRKGTKAVYCPSVVEAEEYLKNNAADYLIFTYPDYLGRDNGIERVYELKCQYGIPLFIDSAHGSHFALSDKLPVSATKYGDLVALSLHKTLPVCTGGALLVGDKAHEDYIGVALRETHTTSPSFMIIESAKWALEEIERSAERYDFTLASIDMFLQDIARDARYSVLANIDKTRLVIDTPWDNQAVVTALEEHGIYAEGSSVEGVIFIVTPYNAKHLSYLALVLKSLDGLDAKKPPLAIAKRTRAIDYSNREYEVVDLDSAVGRVVYQEIGVYPPATPIYFYGDVLSKADVEKLKGLDNVFGLENNGVVVLK